MLRSTSLLRQSLKQASNTLKNNPIKLPQNVQKVEIVKSEFDISPKTEKRMAIGATIGLLIGGGGAFYFSAKDYIEPTYYYNNSSLSRVGIFTVFGGVIGTAVGMGVGALPITSITTTMVFGGLYKIKERKEKEYKRKRSCI